MADSYEQTASSVADAFSSLGEERANQIAALVTGDDGKAVIQAAATLDAATLAEAATNGTEVLQISGGGNFNFDALPTSVKVLVFTEPVVINGQSFVGTVLLGPGNDSVNFSLTQVASGDATGATIDPGAGSNTIVGGAGADIVYVGAGAKDTIDGAAGVDTLKISGKKADYSIVVNGSKVVASNASLGTSVEASNSEIMQFDDGVVVNASNVSEASMARLYEFMFNRAPDAAGMKYWLETMRAGKINLVDAASGFLGSAEAQANGITPATDSATFIDALYLRGLDRPADAGGKAYWVDQLANGASRAEIIAGFTSSEEAQITIVGVHTITGSI